MRCKRGGHAAAAAVCEDAQVRIALLEAGEDGGGGVGAAVIDHQHFASATQLIERLKRAFDDGGDGRLLVARRHDYRDREHRCRGRHDQSPKKARIVATT
jgi:hypothetical protein